MQTRRGDERSEAVEASAWLMGLSPLPRVCPTGWIFAIGRRDLRAAALALSLVGCGSTGRDVHDAFNSRDTGPYESIGRAVRDDGTLVVHVQAHLPQHAEEIARHIVLQNYATAPTAVRVIVDPIGTGARRVYRWDGHALAVDKSSAGLPPPPASAGQDTPGHR